MSTKDDERAEQRVSADGNDDGMTKPLTMLEGFARLNAACWNLNAAFCRTLPQGKGDRAAVYCKEKAAEVLHNCGADDLGCFLKAIERGYAIALELVGGGL